MRKLGSLQLLIFCVFIIACQKEEGHDDKMKGVVTINIGLFINVSEINNPLKSTKTSENFKVIIYDLNHSEIEVFEKASDIPDEVLLDPGRYYVVAHSNNDLPAAFDNPYYYGRSAEFLIEPGEQQSVSVNCELANTIVHMAFSEKVKSNFRDYSAIVSTSAGSLIYAKEETRDGYFRTLAINISVSLTWQKDDGTTGNKTITGVINNPQPKKKYDILIDTDVVQGIALFQLNIDDSSIPVENITLTDSEADPEIGLFKPGDLLITEIMYNPDSLPDNEGEWFEIYNNTNFIVDLYHLVIMKNETDKHIINASILLPAHEYYVLARTDKAVVTNKYIYGSSINLNNDGAILSLSNYGTNGTDGSQIISIDYTDKSFPHVNGTSIILNPEKLNYSESLLGGSWCISTSKYTTGDKGTPGKSNDTCPL